MRTPNQQIHGTVYRRPRFAPLGIQREAVEGMNISLILAHPDPQSFNHAIAQTATDGLKRNGHMVRFHDLYAEKFDPILLDAEIPATGIIPKRIEEHCREVASADGIVVVHPNWWGQPPAILKGWIDRVLRPGSAYNFLEGDAGEGVPIGLLKARMAVVFNTSNTPAERESNVFGDPLELIWKKCIFELCGVKHFYREMIRVVVTSTQSQRAEWLEKVRKTINTYFPKEVKC
jgi:NAD(P)H dehydrogenase (quinone)